MTFLLSCIAFIIALQTWINIIKNETFRYSPYQDLGIWTSHKWPICQVKRFDRREVDRKNWTLENNSVDSNNFFSPSQTIYPPALQCLPQYRWKRFLPFISFWLPFLPQYLCRAWWFVTRRRSVAAPWAIKTLHVLFRLFDAFGLYAMFKFEIENWRP